MKPLRIRDLFTDQAGGYLSHTKIWNNIACTVATWFLVYAAITDKLYGDTLSEFVLWYLAILGGSAILSKGVGFGFGKGKIEAGGDK